MFLKRGILVNWGNIPQLEFEFGPINLFSGGNGSGKTTAADAIQTLMTAAHENLFNYNPGQDETTQRSRGGKQVRTLASYVLGCDDGSYSRPWTSDAYIAGVFQSTQNEGDYSFTALMCMRAHLDKAGKRAQARLDELSFYILPSIELNLSHFVRTYSDGKHVVPVTEISDLLKKEFGSRSVESYDKKGAYLRRLYGALRGRKDAVSDREAKHAARTFANFMAYKPVKNITEFVAREILEPKDLGDAIRNVSELMKTIHQMEQDTLAIRQAIDTLAKAKGESDSYIKIWLERKLSQYAEATRQLKQNHKAYISAKNQQQNTAESIEEIAGKISLGEQRRKQAHEEIIALEAQRQGIQILKDKDELENTIGHCQKKLGEQARPLLEQDQQLKQNCEATKKLLSKLSESSLGVDIPSLDNKTFRQQAKAIATSDSEHGIDFTQLLSKDWIDIAPLENYLDQIILTENQHRQWVALLHNGEPADNTLSLRDQISHQVSQSERKRSELSNKYRQKQKEIQLLENSKVSYPAHTELALSAIRKNCPEADPRVLCDYIEVLDPKWQMAIEGYIGGARFSIIVKEDYEADAIKIVRSLADARRNRARVIQGKKAHRDAERITLPSSSVVEVMDFNHKTAESYIKASYGNVIRVEDAQALRQTPRGITAEGLGAGNYSMWRCDINDSELVFGQGARERAMKAKTRECDELSLETNSAEQYHQNIARVFELVESIKSVKCAEVIESMLSLHRELQQAESALARLDLSDFTLLEAQLEELKNNYQQLEHQIQQLGEESGRLKEVEKQRQKEITKLADAHEKLQGIQDKEELSLSNITGIYPEFDSEKALEEAEDRADKAGSSISFEEDIALNSASLESAERSFYHSIMQHNQHCKPHDAIVYTLGLRIEPGNLDKDENADKENKETKERHNESFFKSIVNLNEQVDLIHNRLQNNILVDKCDKLSSLTESFNTAFVANLCHSIYQAISDGKRILEDLNRELEHHRFGADRERFYFSFDWVPEFRDYWRFFKEVIELPNLGDGASLFEAELSTNAAKIRDKMLAMLLEKDEHLALKELARLSDYRNYRHYEIFKEPEGKAPIALSEYGTGSGGQLETPAYIIRSAAVTSAFRFNEGKTHLRMVLVDEAFSKMDESRSREVIDYLTTTQGLQLLFIMPTSKSGPFMDIISNQFVFSKCPTTRDMGELKTRVLVDRKTCNQETIQSLWANHRDQVRHQGMLDFMQDINSEIDN